MSRLLRAAGRVGIGLAVIAAAGVSAVDAHAAGSPKLTVTAAFTKSSYVSGQAVAVALTVHNSGTAAAVGVEASYNSTSTSMSPDNGGLSVLGDNVTIPAGKSVTTTVTGHLGNAIATSVTLAGDVYARNLDAEVEYSASAPVTVRTEVVRGTAYGDANGNGRPDTGEGVVGLPVSFSYFYGDNTYTVTSGAGGHYAVRLPLAPYRIEGSRGPWHTVATTTTVGTSNPWLFLRAVHPLGNGVLKASLQFTKSTYKVGDTAQITLRLANHGAAPLSGITPDCDHAGDPDELNNAGWGALSYEATAAPLAPHSLSTFHVTGKITAVNRGAGDVVIACDFGYAEVYEGDRPQALARARVPGATGSLQATVTYRSGSAEQPLAGVRLVLVDPTVCPVYQHTLTTDAHGSATFYKAPAGQTYKVYAFPPKGWKVLYGNPANALVYGADTTHFGIEVARGTAKLPTVPTKCS